MNNIYASSCSAAFELENDLCYESPEEYSIYLNGKQIEGSFGENVFSVFDLSPDTEYSVCTSLDERPLVFRTKKESCCVSVRDFGAAGNGIKDDTKAIQAAILTCPEGGRIRIPEGTYLITPLILKSHITIEIVKGAVLIGSTNENDYAVLPGEAKGPEGQSVEFASWEGRPAISHQSLLSAYYSEDIHIVGRGTVDGNAQASTWWIDVKKRATARPRLLFTNQCRGVFIHGTSFKNSPSWNLHPYNSQHIGLYDISVTAPKDSPNTDGCDPESCDTVEIIGARFSVGDDAIAIKSGKMREGKHNIPASNHTVRNCLMEFAHGAVVLGSEMSGGVKVLSVTRCLFKDTDRGLRIKTRRGRGKDAVVDGVTFNNIRMVGVLTPLVINMFYFCDPDGKSGYVQNKNALPVDERTPYLGRFCFKDLICTDCSAAAGFFYGLPEQPIGEIEISNAKFTFRDGAEGGYPAMMLDIEEHSKSGLIFNNVKRVRMHDVSISGVKGEKAIMNNVMEVSEKDNDE
jgi:polygalacturonase